MSYKNKPVSRRKTRFVGYGHAFSSINRRINQVAPAPAGAEAPAWDIN